MDSDEEHQRRSLPEPIVEQHFSTSGPGLIVLALAISMLFFSVPYFIPPPSSQIVNGLMSYYIHEPEVISGNEVWLTFIITRDYSPSPTQFQILLRNSTHKGVYSIPSSANNTLLTLESGDNMGTLMYIDFQDDGRINFFDKIRITGLGPGSDYFVGLTYALSGRCLQYVTFTTPHSG
jgi:hypothetical protein